MTYDKRSIIIILQIYLINLYWTRGKHYVYVCRVRRNTSNQTIYFILWCGMQWWYTNLGCIFPMHLYSISEKIRAIYLPRTFQPNQTSNYLYNNNFLPAMIGMFNMEWLWGAWDIYNNDLGALHETLHKTPLWKNEVRLTPYRTKSQEIASFDRPNQSEALSIKQMHPPKIERSTQSWFNIAPTLQTVLHH